MTQLPLRISRRIALLALSVFFILAGISHFTNSDFYMAIMPPYFPFHIELVYLSGILEILGGVTILFHRFRKYIRWGIILLLLAIYPANIHMALHPELFPDVTSMALYIRLPFQIIFILWAYWATHNSEL
ncbi:MAG: DoxX family protein [Fidelibacterota bacterium]|jgi:uncharacterized membrane protein|tara:strand:+ start:704 stop:1093 length:390 start_codon:yes stop_codon:yes gene_type:complete